MVSSLDNPPQRSSRQRVNSARRFVQEHNLGPAHQSNRHTQLTLVATGQTAGLLVGELNEITERNLKVELIWRWELENLIGLVGTQLEIHLGSKKNIWVVPYLVGSNIWDIRYLIT